MNFYVTAGAFALVTFAAAAVGSIFMPGPWYASLAKPCGRRRTGCFRPPGRCSTS